MLHYHTYSNIYIHAWGDGSLPEEPDLTTLREIGEEMASYNGYVAVLVLLLLAILLMEMQWIGHMVIRIS